MNAAPALRFAERCRTVPYRGVGGGFRSAKVGPAVLAEVDRALGE